MSPRLLVAVPSVAVGALVLTLVTGAVAQAVPLTPHQTPFPCGQAWTGSTRGSHTPSTRSIDFNRAGDEGDAVVASASGIVSKADSVSTRSYGHHVVIDHRNGESSIYAHLDKVTVTTGQYVDQGAMVGTVGNTGNSQGAHLHYEQRVGKQVTSAAFGGVPYAYGTTISTNCVDVPIAGDFTGDGAADVAVYRRAAKSSFIVNDPAGARLLMFGSATDEPLVGDWDGNGVADLGLRRPKPSKFLLRGAAGVVKIRYGLRSDRAVVGDWDGNGTDEVGVHRPSTGTFHQRLADGSSVAVPLGDANDLPVTGDWDGNKVTDLGVFDQASAMFTLRIVDTSGVARTVQLQLGTAGDLPVAGDWNGDGLGDLGVWSPSTAVFTQGRTVSPLTAVPAAARLEVTTIQFGQPRG